MSRIRKSDGWSWDTHDYRKYPIWSYEPTTFSFRLSNLWTNFSELDDIDAIWHWCLENNCKIVRHEVAVDKAETHFKAIEFISCPDEATATLFTLRWVNGNA
jgi:hypothetical protein